MSDDFFDDFDAEPLDANFFQQVDTLEQVALSQHPRAAAHPPPPKRQKLDHGADTGVASRAGVPERQDATRPGAVAERFEAEGDQQSADLALQWEQALAHLEAENARLRQQQTDLAELQRRVLAREGEAATLRRHQTLAEQKSNKALQEEQDKNRQLQDQITAMKQQFVADLERANTQRAFQKHEQEAAQRRAKLQWHQHAQRPVKSPSKSNSMGFQSSFVDAKAGPARRASPRSTPVKNSKSAVGSPTPSRPQSPLASKSQHVEAHTQQADGGAVMDVDETLEAIELVTVDYGHIRAKIIASLFAHRYQTCEALADSDQDARPRPTFHLLTNFKPPSGTVDTQQRPLNYNTAVSALFSALSATSSEVATEGALQHFADQLVQSLVLFVSHLSIVFSITEDEASSQTALQPLAAVLDWLSVALIRFHPYIARACLVHSTLFEALDRVVSMCVSVKPQSQNKKSDQRHALALPLLLHQQEPKVHFLLNMHVKAHILFPVIAVLEGLVWLPQADTYTSLESGLMDTHLVAKLLDVNLPPPVLFRSLQWLLLTARYSQLYKSLLAAPFAQGPADIDSHNSRIHLIETMAGYLHYSSYEASPTLQACIHQAVLYFFLRLYSRNDDAPTLLSSSQALVPKLIFRMAWDTGLLYESDGEGFGRLPPHLVVKRLCAATKLLYLLAGTPRQLQRFNLKTQIHHSLAHYNGVLQMFNVSIGRLATADSPRWLDVKDRKMLDDSAEPAQLLLDLVLSPGEQDDLYALNQGEDPGDADMTNDHEEQQIAAEHLAELEDDEATQDD